MQVLGAAARQTHTSTLQDDKVGKCGCITLLGYVIISE